MLNIHITHSDKQIRYNICAINDCAHNKYNIYIITLTEQYKNRTTNLK